MPLGTPNYNPPRTERSSSRSPQRRSATVSPSGGSMLGQFGTPLGSGNQIGPVAPGTLTPRGTPYSSFQVTPEYSNVGAWGGWGEAAGQHQQGGYLQGVAGESWNFLTGGAYDPRRTVEQHYIQQYGREAVERAKKSGMDPETFFSLGKGAQDQAVAWGTNLGNARDIIAGQESAYDARLGQQQQTNAWIDEFGALQDLRSTNLLDQFTGQSAMAQARHDMALDHLNTNLGLDLGILDQRRYRDVDLGRADNAAALLHNRNMRGVLDTNRGLIGQEFRDRQGYLNERLGFIGDRQDLAYNQYQTNDAYKAQQARDLMAQYGFAGREYDAQMEESFANRNTQQRAATSDAAARGAFGSAGFGDNIQDIYGQYGRNVDAAGLQLDRTTQSIEERDRAIGNERRNLGFGYEGQVIGFNEDIAGINYQHAQNKTNTEGAYNTLRGQYSANDLERTKLQNVNKGLDSIAKEYGLRSSQIQAQFDQAVDRLGLDLNETQQRLEQMLNSGNADLMAQGMNFMRQMMAYQ